MSAEKNILIVDDDKLTAQATKAILEHNGYKVKWVQDGEVALNVLEDIVPDLMILDIVMPNVDGFTVAKKLKYKDKLKAIPIIIMSAKEGMKELFAIEGITDYLIKPVNHEELLELVHKRLGK